MLTRDNSALLKKDFFSVSNVCIWVASQSLRSRGTNFEKEGLRTRVFDPISYLESQCPRLKMPIHHKNVVVCLL